MARLILSLGEPGSGKSRAIMNLDPKTTVLIKPNYKELPFKGASKVFSTENKNVAQKKTFLEVKEFLDKVNTKPEIKTVVIEDLSHYFNERVMKDAKITGFQKWTDLALDVFNSLIKAEESLRDDLTVIVIAHTERSSDVQGNTIITLYTPGKLLENNIKIPSYFTYIIHTDVKEVNGKMEYSFLTNTDGTRIAKSPEGCLEMYEPNDYKLILEKIAKYQLGE